MPIISDESLSLIVLLLSEFLIIFLDSLDKVAIVNPIGSLLDISTANEGPDIIDKFLVFIY